VVLRLAAAFLAAAAAAAAWGGGAAPVVRVLVLDRSRSVRGGAESENDAWLAARGTDESAGPPAVVHFAETAEVLRLPGGGGGGKPKVALLRGDATDLAAGLRAGLSLVPSGAAGEVVVATDGRGTTGDLESALALARQRGIAVRAIPWGKGVLPARAAAVEAPALVRPGDRFPVSVLVTGGAGAEGEVRLEDEGAGETESRRVRVPEGGRARVVFARTAGVAGVRRYRAFVPGPCEDAVAEAAVLVVGDAAVLRLGAGPPLPGSAALLRRLGGGGFRDASGAEGIAAALKGTDLSSLAAVVLDDVPEAMLPSEAGERMLRAIEGGLGLVVLGGPRTLGAGGWAGRPLEDALPVRCAPDRPRPLVVLAVDASGSMEGGTGDGGSPASAAREAGAALARRLPSDVRLALLRFSDRVAGPAGVFDLSDPAQRSSAQEEAGRAFVPGGGTRLGAAAEGALEAAARAPGGGSRTLLLVTDGRPSEGPEDLRRIGASLREARFAVRVVPVGGEADAARLGAFVEGAGGAVVPTDAGAAALAGTLLAESSGADAALWRPGAAAVRPGPDPGPFGAAPAGLPPVAGFDRVFPGPGALLWLRLEGGEPLLAARQVGLGRSVVFASPPAAGSGEWASGQAADVLDQALRWAIRAPQTEIAEGRALRQTDGTVRVVLETEAGRDPRGEVRAGGVALRRTGASRWEGVLPSPGDEGVVLFEAGGTVLARVAAAAGPSPEDAALGPDPAALGALEVPGRPPASRAGAGPVALGAALLALALLAAAAAGDGRSSHASPAVGGR
jgi:Mg-chelatase subunit ChlD